MQKLIGLVRRCVEDYNMIAPGDKIAVGVSGGKDSVVLLQLLAGLREYSDFELEAVFADHTSKSAICVVVRVDGLTLLFTGDTYYHEKLREYRRFCPDILFICINGKLGNTRAFHLPYLLFVAAAFGLLFWCIYNKTRHGKRCRHVILCGKRIASGNRNLSATRLQNFGKIGSFGFQMNRHGDFFASKRLCLFKYFFNDRKNRCVALDPLDLVATRGRKCTIFDSHGF